LTLKEKFDRPSRSCRRSPARMADGSAADDGKIYPETVLFRLIRSDGRPSVKISTSEQGSGLTLGGGIDPTYIYCRERPRRNPIPAAHRQGWSAAAHQAVAAGAEGSHRDPLRIVRLHMRRPATDGSGPLETRRINTTFTLVFRQFARYRNSCISSQTAGTLRFVGCTT
jgi:hypothetical protein